MVDIFYSHPFACNVKQLRGEALNRPFSSCFNLIIKARLSARLIM